MTFPIRADRLSQYQRAGLDTAGRLCIARSSDSNILNRIGEAIYRTPILSSQLSGEPTAWRVGRGPAISEERFPFASAGEHTRRLLSRIALRELNPYKGPAVRMEVCRFADGDSIVAISTHPLLINAAMAMQLTRFIAGHGAMPTMEEYAVHREPLLDDTAPNWTWAEGRGERGFADVALSAEREFEDDALVMAVARTLAMRENGPVQLVVSGAQPALKCLTIAMPGQENGHLRAEPTDTDGSIVRNEGSWNVQISLTNRSELLERTPARIMIGRHGATGLVATIRTETISVNAASRFLEDVVAHLTGDTMRSSYVATPSPVRSADFIPTIDGRVANWARHTPEAIAIRYCGEELTYAELDLLSEQIAAALHFAGVDTGKRVGVALPRCLGLVVALLGVLKIGAAYVPLDIAYPIERLMCLVDDAALDAIIYDGEITLPGKCPRIVVDQHGRPHESSSPPRPHTASHTPSSPAYMIYTSGSTGRPKGVLVSHASVIALIDATREDFTLCERDIWSAFHSYAFDFSVWEIWGCLTTGGRLIIVPDSTRLLAEEFRELLIEERVSVLNQTPSAFAALISVDIAAPPALHVRLLIFGGEPLDPRLLLRWFDRYPERECQAVNMYGITETTVHSTWQIITRCDALRGTRSIGVPLRGWDLAIMDQNGELVPQGVVGEISVGGVGLAYGYHGSASLTAERYVADSLSGVPGRRRYRSGDFGRLCGDGTFEYWGRMDRQVKVRGYRIELDEIRHALLTVPGIKAAAVVLRERGSSGDRHIDAFIVGDAQDVYVLQHLARHLPPYMIPSTVTTLAELPLTVNGKLDQSRLPQPESLSRPRAQGMAFEAGGLDSTIAAVWNDVLGVQLGLDDNFFLNGGNSLLAIRVIARLRAETSSTATARMLYEHPTIRDFARALALSK